MTIKKVLMVDDDEVFRAIMTDALAEKGFEVAEAKDGIEGIEKAKAEPFDIVLLDLLLPKMTGFDVLKEIRKERPGPDLPVLAVSGVYRKEEHISALKDYGANGFISKNATPAQIAERVVMTMEAAAKAAPAAPAPKDEKPKQLDPAAALAKVEIFQELNKEELDEVLQISKRIKFKKGEIIITEGEEGDRFYGVISGTIRVEKMDVSDKPTVLAMLGPGAGFGELALADRDRRSATCLAETEVEVLEIARDNFEQLLAADPELERKCLRALLKLMAQRLRDTDTSLTFSRALIEKVIETEQ